MRGSRLMACRRADPQAGPAGLGLLAMIACGMVLGAAWDPPCAWADEPQAAGVAIRSLLDEPDGLIDLALSPNGQRLYGLSTDGETVVSLACGRNASAEVRTVIEGESADGPGRSIGCIDSSVVAILRDTPATVITTHRIPPPPETAVASSPLQRIALDNAPPTAAASATSTAGLTVSHTRNWLAVTTPPAAVLRAAIAGVRLGSLSPRNCPELAAGVDVRAAAVSPADELVLVTASSETASAGQPPSTNSLSMYATPGGWELLRLDTGLSDVRDACYTTASGSLWVITGSVASADSPQPAGLWRLDAALRNRRQAISAVLVTALEAPLAVAAGNDEVLYALVEDGRRVVEIRPQASRD